MRYRSIRIGLAVAAVLACVAAGVYVVRLEREADRITAQARTFGQQAQGLVAQVAALKSAERAYVAPGQGTDFWTQHASTLLVSIRQGLATLAHTDTSADAAAALESAAAAAGQLAAMDARVRRGLSIGDEMMASDTIFSEGEQDTANLTRQLDIARTRQQAHAAAAAGGLRRNEVLAATAAVLFSLVILIALVPAVHEAEAPEALLGPALVLAPAAEGETEAASDFGQLRFDGPAAGQPPAPPAPAAPDLAAAAALCEEIARLDAPAGLPMLLERVASLLDATGVVLWAAASGGTELRPALAHGYPPQVMARMTSVPRDANNITAAAYRTGHLQAAASDAVTNGALAVPLPGPDGPTGVLTTEMRNGGEADPARRALASIFAAQFATIVGTVPPAATGGVAQSVQ